MYAEYATDPRMRRNIGISRRLFPLLDNDQDVVRALPRHAVLDAGQPRPLLRRRDRDGRQHLPRRPRRRAHPDAVDPRPQRRVLHRRLRPALPAAADGPGVRLPGRQRGGASSATRRRSCTGCGACSRCARSTPCSAPAPSRCSTPTTRRCSPTSAADDGPDTVLCVNNLSRFPQPCELMLEQHAGQVPVELTGRVPFPPIGELPYFVTLAPHGFYWFSLRTAGGGRPAVIDPDRLATLLVEHLPAHLARQRWSGAHERRPSGPCASTGSSWCRPTSPLLVWALVECTFADGGRQPLPAASSAAGAADPLPTSCTARSASSWLWCPATAGDVVLYDALVDPDLAIAVLHLAAPDAEVEVRRPIVLEHSNSSVVFDESIDPQGLPQGRAGPEPRRGDHPRRWPSTGYEHVLPPLAELATGRHRPRRAATFLVGATEGWQLARTSVRDLLASRLPPEESGGDFAPDIGAPRHRRRRPPPGHGRGVGPRPRRRRSVGRRDVRVSSTELAAGDAASPGSDPTSPRTLVRQRLETARGITDAGHEHPDPRRPPPRPGDPGRRRVGWCSTSRASRPASPSRALHHLVAAARRGRHPPVVPLRRRLRAG